MPIKGTECEKQHSVVVPAQARPWHTKVAASRRADSACSGYVWVYGPYEEEAQK